MPDFLWIYGVAADLSGVDNPKVRKRVEALLPSEDDTEHTWRTLSKQLEKALALAPALRLDFACESPGEFLSLVRVREGRIDDLSVVASLSRTSYVPVDVPEYPPRVEVECDADLLADAIAPDAEGVRADEGLLLLPVGWKDVAAMSRTLVRVAGAMRQQREAYLLRAGAHRYVAELTRSEGVRLRPTWYWVEEGTKEDLATFARVMQLPEHPDFPWGELQPAQPPPPEVRKVAGRPFSSGAARSRLSAITDVHLARKDRPLPVEALLQALADPENAGPAFAEVRRKLYSVVSEEDRDDVRDALRAGLRDEPEEVATFIGEILWRQKPLLERLVREELLAAWTERPEYAKRLVHAAREAYLEVPESWVREGPAPLRRALAGLIVAGR
jgi:hypothetical protein